MGWGKVACWSTEAAISLKRVKIEEKLLWRAYRNSPTLLHRAVISAVAQLSCLILCSVHSGNIALRSLLLPALSYTRDSDVTYL